MSRSRAPCTPSPMYLSRHALSIVPQKTEHSKYMFSYDGTTEMAAGVSKGGAIGS